MNKNYIIFGNYPFGRHTSVEILTNEGMFNDIEKALNHYYAIFGLTEALRDLNAVYFRNGQYEFYFEKEQSRRDEALEQLVQFILVLDFEVSYDCFVKVAEKIYEFRKGYFSETDVKMRF